MDRLVKVETDKVTINSSPITNPELVANRIKRFGIQCIVSSVDCKAIDGTWKVISHSGLRSAEVNVLEHPYIY